MSPFPFIKITSIEVWATEHDNGFDNYMKHRLTIGQRSIFCDQYMAIELRKRFLEGKTAACGMES